MRPVNKPSPLRYHPDHRQGDGLPPLHATRLYELIGREHSMAEVERSLRAYVDGEQPPVVGALQLTCSDEAEYEVSDLFRSEFVAAHLPALQFDEKAPFQTTTLGARYEWGAARVAEDHFAQVEGAEDWKLMVLKLNAHVGADALEGYPASGWLSRFGKPSSCCGALHALMGGDTRPFAEELAETFGAEGVDRVAQLRAVPEEHRMLLAAVTQARLQARRAMLDVQDHAHATPTVTLILPCVSLNQRNRDTEVVVGVYVCDRRGDPHDEYCGLGDLPAEYEVSGTPGSLRIADPGIGTPRLARDHRQLVRSAWAARREAATSPHQGELGEALRVAREHDPSEHHVSRAALAGLLGAAAAVAPIPAALALFGEGALAIHHSTRAHRLLREAEGDPAARRMLAEVQGRLEGLDPEQTRHLVQLLVEAYGRP